MNSIRSLWLIVVMFGITTLNWQCASDPVEDEAVIDVKPEFQPYLDAYIVEANKRGVETKFEETGLSIDFTEKQSGILSGVCFIGQHKIEIDRSDWNTLSDNEKEGLIFHELGHCHLDRGHTNVLLPNGEWKSRMRGDPFEDEMMSTNVNYSGRRRDYYIEELFNENIPSPDWVNITQDYGDITDEQREVLYARAADTTQFRERQFLSPGTNWEIELEMNNRETDNFIALVWGQESNERSWRIGYDEGRRFIIVSGQEIWGTIYFNTEQEEIINREYNKITVRQIDNLIYVFINESFLYWFDYNDQNLGTVQSLDRNDSFLFRNIRISKLNI